MKNNHHHIINSATNLSLIKAIDLINYFAAFNEVGISKISKELGIPKSTVFNILNTLRVKGVVTQNPQTRKYSLTQKSRDIAINTQSNDLNSIARKYIRDLCTDTGEIVLLSVSTGNDVLIIERIEPDNPFLSMPKLSYTTEYHCSSCGKVLLASSATDLQQRVLARKKFTKYTVHTIATTMALRKELKHVLKAGYATDIEETMAGVCCCAVPIKKATGEVIAAVSVVVPTESFTDNRRRSLISKLKKCALNISTGLGYKDQTIQ